MTGLARAFLRTGLRLAYGVIGAVPVGRVAARGKTALLAVRRRLHKPGGREMEVVDISDGGLKLAVNVCEQLGGDLYYGAGFEDDEIALFRTLLQPGWTVFDVGGNVGIYTLVASNGVTVTGHVHAFEPISEVHDILAANVARNGARNVTLNRAAVSDAPGEAELFVNEDTALTSMGSTGRGKVVSVSRVPVVTLDHYAREHGVDAIDLLKIDVEGFEGHVLRGAEALLERSRDVIIFSELAQKNFEPLKLRRDDVFTWLKARAFTVAWQFDRRGRGVLPLAEPWDASPNQNFLFVRPGSGAERLVAAKVRERTP